MKDKLFEFLQVKKKDFLMDMNFIYLPFFVGPSALGPYTQT